MFTRILLSLFHAENALNASSRTASLGVASGCSALAITRGLEGQAALLSDLVVVPVLQVTELELQFPVLLLEEGNFAVGRYQSSIGRRLAQPLDYSFSYAS